MSTTLDYRETTAPRSEAQKLEDRQATMARQQASIEKQQAKLELMAQAGQVVWIRTVDVSFKALVAIGLSPRDASFAIPEAKVGDRVYVHRRARPSISGIVVAPLLTIEGTGYVPEDKKVEVYYLCPVLGIAQTLTIPLTLIGYRAATV